MTPANDRTTVPPPFRVQPWARARFALARTILVAASVTVAACAAVDRREARPAASVPVAGVERDFVRAEPVAVLTSEPCGEPACAPADAARRDWYAGGAFSYGPDLGASIEVGRVIARNPTATWSVEGPPNFEL